MWNFFLNFKQIQKFSFQTGKVKLRKFQTFTHMKLILRNFDQIGPGKNPTRGKLVQERLFLFIREIYKPSNCTYLTNSKLRILLYFFNYTESHVWLYDCINSCCTVLKSVPNSSISEPTCCCTDALNYVLSASKTVPSFPHTCCTDCCN